MPSLIISKGNDMTDRALFIKSSLPQPVSLTFCPDDTHHPACLSVGHGTYLVFSVTLSNGEKVVTYGRNQLTAQLRADNFHFKFGQYKSNSKQNLMNWFLSKIWDQLRESFESARFHMMPTEFHYAGAPNDHYQAKIICSDPKFNLITNYNHPAHLIPKKFFEGAG